MTRAEAISLAAQLGHQIKTVKAFEELLDSKKLKLALDNFTGGWAVINEKGAELASVA